jgi:hypothetical protein
VTGSGCGYPESERADCTEFRSIFAWREQRANAAARARCVRVRTGPSDNGVEITVAVQDRGLRLAEGLR